MDKDSLCCTGVGSLKLCVPATHDHRPPTMSGLIMEETTSDLIQPLRFWAAVQENRGITVLMGINFSWCELIEYFVQVLCWQFKQKDQYVCIESIPWDTELYIGVNQDYVPLFYAPTLRNMPLHWKCLGPIVFNTHIRPVCLYIRIFYLRFNFLITWDTCTLMKLGTCIHYH